MFEGPRRSLDEYLSILEVATTLPGYVNVKRRAHINFSWLDINIKEGHWKEDALIPPALPIDLLAKIHECFGGELYHQGVLCFKDGQLVTRMFQHRSMIPYRHKQFQTKMDYQKVLPSG